MEKLKMTQDALYKYIVEHDVKITRIADEMGQTRSAVASCFQHHKNRHGKPRYFSVENVAKLNDALHALAVKLRSCLLKFGTSQMYTNKHGHTYDPGMIEPINNLGEYLNMTAVIQRLLGWSKSKKNNVFGAPTVKNYGNISEEDVDKINMEVLAIIGVFENIEVTPDENAYDGSNSDSSSSK